MDKIQIKNNFRAGIFFKEFLSEVREVIEEFEKENHLKADVKDDIREIKRRIWKIKDEKNIYPDWVTNKEEN